MQVSDNSPPRGSVRVRVKTQRRGSVRVRTPSRGGRLPAGGIFGSGGGVVAGWSCLQGCYLLESVRPQRRKLLDQSVKLSLFSKR